MSDKDTKTLEGSAADSDKDEAISSAASAAPLKATANRRGGGARAFFFFLLFLGLIAIAAYYGRDKVTHLQNEANHALQTLDINRQQIGQFALAIGQLQQNQNNLEQTLTDYIDDQQDRIAELERRVIAAEGTTTLEWKVAEARYLVRLADRRLQIGGDTPTAIALLADADSILKDIGQARFTDARAALIEDISRLRAVGEVDTQGLYLQISAVARRASQLPLRSTPGFEFGAAAQPEVDLDQNWWQQLLEQAKVALAKVLLVRKAADDTVWMLDSQSEAAVRARVGLLITQSLSALLAEQQSLFAASLGQVAEVLQRYYEPGVALTAVQSELENLAGISLQRNQLDVQGSVAAMDLAMQQAANAGD